MTLFLECLRGRHISLAPNNFNISGQDRRRKKRYRGRREKRIMHKIISDLENLPPWVLTVLAAETGWIMADILELFFRLLH
jgi:hypothetical protein